jgi:hypothetical protein
MAAPRRGGVCDDDCVDVADCTGDACEDCPAGPGKVAPGLCGCGTADTDADRDGTPDCLDACPADPADDADHDGICGDVDRCPGTVLPESVPTDGLGVNRFADTNGDGVFDTVSPKGKGPGRHYTLADAAGCSCGQIIDRLGLGEGHRKFGCSISAMDDWLAYVKTH